MNLPFSTKLPSGTPSRFVEKIWASSPRTKTLRTDLYVPDQTRLYAPKLHTIRKNESDAWTPGKWIHFVINQQTSKRYVFAEGRCISTQRIAIYPPATPLAMPWIDVDGRSLDEAETRKLIENDGFDTVYDFNNFFRDTYRGILIHWTDLRY